MLSARTWLVLGLSRTAGGEENCISGTAGDLCSGSVVGPVALWSENPQRETQEVVPGMGGSWFRARHHVDGVCCAITRVTGR